MNDLSAMAATTWPPDFHFIWVLLKQIPSVLGSLMGTVSLFITITVMCGVWFLGKYNVEKVLRSILTVVVAVVSIGVATWVNYEMRVKVVEEAESRSVEASNLAKSEFEKTKGKPVQDIDDVRTNAIIDMDQAIAKITSQIYLVVYYRFPEANLRSVSVHLLRPVPEGKIATDVLNIVQEGRSEKDSSALSLSHSFIGYAIVHGTEQYCPDVRVSTDAKCPSYERIAKGAAAYASLFCQPLGEASPGTLSSAGICFDSTSPQAFDDAERTRMIDTLSPQFETLSVLLSDYRNLLGQELSLRRGDSCVPWLPDAPTDRYH